MKYPKYHNMRIIIVAKASFFYHHIEIILQLNRFIFNQIMRILSFVRAAVCHIRSRCIARAREETTGQLK